MCFLHIEAKFQIIINYNFVTAQMLSMWWVPIENFLVGTQAHYVCALRNDSLKEW